MTNYAMYLLDYDVSTQVNIAIGLCCQKIGGPLSEMVCGRDDLCDWPNQEEDMAILSKTFPNVLFTLNCEDEMSDKWIEYWKNGKSQLCPGKTIYDEYDESKLDEYF